MARAGSLCGSESKGGYLEGNAMADREPVQFSKDGDYVLPRVSVADQASRSVLDFLQVGIDHVGNLMQRELQ